MQVNRAFGTGDTVIFIPLLVASFIGLWLKKRWSLMTTAAVSGVSAYWSITIISMLLFLPGTPGYNYNPGSEIWLFVTIYAIFGLWGIIYLVWRGDNLIR